MSAGFVYIMINPVMPSLVKIGLTKDSSSVRARRLRGTGVPDKFVVVYDELVTDCAEVERRVHTRFENYRYSDDREFFEVPIRDAIRALMEESVGFLVPRIGSNSGVEILPDLLKKYRPYMKPDFHSVKIVHRDEVVYLETTRFRYTHHKDEIVERTDLGFIIEGDDEPMFPSTRSPDENARIFVHNLDPYSIIMCTDLFTHEASLAIDEKHRSGRSA